MPNKFFFGPTSTANLKGVHPSLVQLAREVLRFQDIVVVDGTRTIEEQRKYVDWGVSKTMDSKHLIQSDGFGHALDLLPYPRFDWNAPRANNDLLLFGGFVLGIAAELGIRIRYGGDWNGNWKNSDNGFQDLDHFELVIVQ